MNDMKKPILYRLFRLGSFPRKLLPILEQESIIVLDEGISGWLISKNVNGPGKRFRLRAEWFLGCLAVTHKRVICLTFQKRQINISLDDARMPYLYVNTTNEGILSVSFEASAFRDGWNGVIELRFNTEKAIQFYNVLRASGAQQGAASDRHFTDAP